MNSFTVDDINNIHQSYKDFFDENAVEIQKLFELRSEKFIEWIRYRYNIGIGDVIQHKKETYFGKPKTVWILGYSMYKAKPLRLDLLNNNRDLLTNDYICLKGRMYDPVKGGYRRYKNIYNISAWSVVAYRDPSLNVSD